MSPDTFKQNALANIGIVASKFAEQLKPAEKLDIQSEGAATTSASLFGEAPADGDDPAFVFGAAQSADEEVFSEAFAPFRVLPKREKDEAGNMIAQALISGNLQDAIDCCFQSEKFADALLIASCGPQELFQMTRERYIRHDNSTLTRLISHISQDKLDNFVRYAKTKDWREIFAVLCNYAKDDFEKNAEFLGRRLITERNDYNAALICFVAAKQYDMVQQCLFQIYETVENKDTSSASVVLLILEKLCAMAGTKADEVVAPIAKTFLQHVIQSGHKDDAIRFVNAFPANSRLQELKAALTGQAISHQQSPQQQQQRRPYNPQQQQQPPIGVPNTFQPQQQPGMPPQPGVQQPQPQQPRPGPTGVFTPSMGPQHGPPPPGKAVPPPPPTGSQPTAAPNQYNRQGQYVSPPGAYNNPTFVPVSQPPLQSAGFQPQQQVRPPPPGPAPTQMTPPGSLHQGVQPPPPQASPVINAPPPAFMPQIVAPPTTPMMPNAGPAPGSFGGYPGAPSMGQQQPSQPSAPPPAAQPNINVPPPAPTVVMPQIQMPSVAPQPMMPTPGPQGVPVNAPPRMEAPPMAQPNINAPPPMTIVPPPVPMAGGQPQPGMPQMGQAPGMPYGAPQQARAAPAQAPPPPPKKSPEATIDEVPDSYRPLAEQLQALVQGIESRPNMNTANKKALQDAAAKLPFVYGLLRDEAVPEALATDIIQFIQKINGGDVAGANQIRKNAIVQHMSKCRDAVLIMNYISNAIR
ncbi:hypothetical protein TRFO_04313 [Tritrichomonas foetus]|uniref:Sec16 Sec23-binding domain-containing protein n=1 Tax=Tritrichomonas foetus TaxID=1144522 RepID=A0A1J4KH44_9EUKA|nr:hypothetical protein TRFO_04313 [Tritrichomonas foetus]|eukprot:OHT10280.1 hypothetical protein TRFO_04313 [Tritrichomonas foetus]